MLESVNFNLDGINSYDMGIFNVHVDTSLITESFLPNTSIQEESVRGRDEPYLMDVSRDPISIPLTLYFEDSFTKRDLRNVARWLKGDRDIYRPFYFISDETDRMFFVSISGEPTITHNGDRGYIDLVLRTSSPFGYSKIMSTKSYRVDGSRVITVDNYGDETISPEIEIKNKNSEEFHFINRTNVKYSFDFVGLNNNETIYIDSDLEDIVSSEEENGVYRYDNFEGRFPKLVMGKNEIEIIGDCEVIIKFRAILLQG